MRSSCGLQFCSITAREHHCCTKTSHQPGAGAAKPARTARNQDSMRSVERIRCVDRRLFGQCVVVSFGNSINHRPRVFRAIRRQ